MSAACSFAATSGTSEFDDVEFLSEAVSVWNALFDEPRPDAIVCEFSPALSLAAF